MQDQEEGRELINDGMRAVEDERQRETERRDATKVFVSTGFGFEWGRARPREIGCTTFKRQSLNNNSQWGRLTAAGMDEFLVLTKSHSMVVNNYFNPTELRLTTKMQPQEAARRWGNWLND